MIRLGRCKTYLKKYLSMEQWVPRCDYFDEVICERVLSCGMCVAETCLVKSVYVWMLNCRLYDARCKHNIVDNSWSLHKFKWKWFNLYINFESCENKKWFAKPSNICWQNNSKNSTCCRRRCKWCASDEIDQVL